MYVYFCLDSAVLHLSVQRCLYYNKERAHWALRGDCKLPTVQRTINISCPSAQYSPQLVTINWRGQCTVQECFTVQRLLFGYHEKWGYRGFAAGLHGCHMYTVLVCEWEVERAGWGHLSEELLNVFCSAARGVVIWALHITSRRLHTIVAFGN